ncbi:MAG TPA: MMPL family transporter, partial [Micromonosporaceae bacterium]|nr:MMPL family transporter [Micromonosporaceae bacterium]
MARRPRTLLAIAGLIMIAALVVGVGAFGKLKGGGFDDPAAESTRAQQLIDSRFGGEANLALLVTAQHGTVDDQAAASAGRAVTDRLRSQADVSDVVSYWSTGSRAMRSDDGRQAIVLAHVDGTDDQVLTRTKALIPTLTTDTGP